MWFKICISKIKQVFILNCDIVMLYRFDWSNKNENI